MVRKNLAVLIICTEQRDHFSDFYFCLLDINCIDFKKKCSCSLLFTFSHKISKVNSSQYIHENDDSDFEEALIKSHLIIQGGLNNLIRDLSLSKKHSEDHDTKISKFRLINTFFLSRRLLGLSMVKSILILSSDTTSLKMFCCITETYSILYIWIMMLMWQKLMKTYNSNSTYIFNVRGELEVAAVLFELQQYSKFCCFLYGWGNQDSINHYHKEYDVHVLLQLLD